jgi:hypothetical protein
MKGFSRLPATGFKYNVRPCWTFFGLEIVWMVARLSREKQESEEKIRVAEADFRKAILK